MGLDDRLTLFRPTILSIIEGYLGHLTFGDLLQTYGQHTQTCALDLYWHHQERELHTRILNRLLSYYNSHTWVRQRNLDGFVLRYHLGIAYMTRRLIQRRLRAGYSAGNYADNSDNYNVLHLHTQVIGLLSADLMAQIPTVVSLDRTIVQAAKEQVLPGFEWTFAANIHLERQVFQNAQRIVSFSEYARRSVIEDQDIDAEKVIVIYPGVDTDRITPGSPSPDLSTHHLLFVGGEFERKGGYDLLAVFLEQFAETTQLHLVTQTQIQCDHPHVHVYAQIQAYTPAWLQLYQQADIFVMPTYSEPLGWVFLEAMAAGLPIVATHLNAIPELVIPGETGLLIAAGDRSALAQSLQTLLNQPTLRQSMGQQGRQRAEQCFQQRTQFGKLEAVFHQAAAQFRESRDGIDNDAVKK